MLLCLPDTGHVGTVLSNITAIGPREGSSPSTVTPFASFSHVKPLNDHESHESHNAVTMQAANERLIELQKGGGSNEMYLQQEGHLKSLAEEIALLATVKQQLEDAITVSVAKGLHFAVKTGDGDTVSSSKTISGNSSSSSIE